MNFTQLHERLRLELLRRIQRGTLSVSLLARQSGFGVSHVSGFLHSRKQLSLEGLDRILAAQQLAVSDLLPAGHGLRRQSFDGESVAVPVISHATALFEPHIRASAAQWSLQLPAGALRPLRTRTTHARRTAWERFVAVRIPADEAAAMEPLIQPDALVIIDRHYNSLVPYQSDRANLYAVRDGSHLILRYCDFAAARLVLRPLECHHSVDLIEVASESSPSDWITGRVVLIISEL
jgi:hypothetical protein